MAKRYADDSEKVIYARGEGTGVDRPTHVQRGDKKNELRARADKSGWDEVEAGEDGKETLKPYRFKNQSGDDTENAVKDQKKKSAASKRYSSED